MRAVAPKTKKWQEGSIFVTMHSKHLVHPITGHEGPEVEERYSSTLSLTLALDGGGWSAPRAGRCTSGKEPVPVV